MNSETITESKVKKTSTAVKSPALNDVVMPAVDLEKWAFVRKQTEEMMDKGRPFVRCGCGRKLWMYQTYKCLYCDEAYCAKCAEEHFGKTREEYRKEKQA